MEDSNTHNFSASKKYLGLVRVDRSKSSKLLWREYLSVNYCLNGFYLINKISDENKSPLRKFIK